MKENLFTEEFLNKIEGIEESNGLLYLYMESLKMSFHDAVVKISEKFALVPEYIYPGYQSNKMSEEDFRKLMEDYWG